MSDISDFLTSKADYAEKWLKNTEAHYSSKSDTDHAPDYVIQLPVHAKESHLVQTLETYITSDALNYAQRILLLINNGDTEDIDRILSEIDRFTSQYPDFPLDCYVARDRNLFANISEVRGFLSLISLLYLSRFPHSRSLFVHHDADMCDIAPDYFETATTIFADNGVSAVGGRIKYSTESPITSLLRSIEDEYYLLQLQRKEAKPRMCGANTIIRPSGYIASGGHNYQFKRKVNIPLRDALLKQDENSVQHSDQAPVTVSARRAIASMNLGIHLANQHNRFFQPGDCSEDYLNAPNPCLVHDSLSPDQQKQFISVQITELLLKSISISGRFASNKFRKKESKNKNMTQEERVRAIMADESVRKVAQKCRKDYVEICKKLGLTITIDEDIRAVLVEIT